MMRFVGVWVLPDVESLKAKDIRMIEMVMIVEIPIWMAMKTNVEGSEDFKKNIEKVVMICSLHPPKP